MNCGNSTREYPPRDQSYRAINRGGVKRSRARSDRATLVRDWVTCDVLRFPVIDPPTIICKINFRKWKKRLLQCSTIWEPAHYHTLCTRSRLLGVARSWFERFHLETILQFCNLVTVFWFHTVLRLDRSNN